MVKHEITRTSDKPPQAPPHARHPPPNPSPHKTHSMTRALSNSNPKISKFQNPNSKIQSQNPIPPTPLLTIKNHQNLIVRLHYHPPNPLILADILSSDESITYSKNSKVYPQPDPPNYPPLTTLNRFQIHYDFNQKILILGGQSLRGGGVCSSRSKNKVQQSKNESSKGPLDQQATKTKQKNKKPDSPPSIYAGTPVNRDAQEKRSEAPKLSPTKIMKHKIIESIEAD
jgi:cGMP-dependent protein kinase